MKSSCYFLCRTCPGPIHNDGISFLQSQHMFKEGNIKDVDQINLFSSLFILLFMTSDTYFLVTFFLSIFFFFSCGPFASFQSILTIFMRPESLFSSPQCCNRSQRTYSRWQQRQHHHLYPDLGPLAGWLRQQIASWTRRYDKCVYTFPSSISPLSTCWPYRWLADGACFSSVCLSYLHFLAQVSHLWDPWQIVFWNSEITHLLLEL